MTIESQNQLLSIDDISYLSDVSDDNGATVSGGTFGLLSWLFGGYKGWGTKPSGGSSGSNGYTIINNNYNTIYVITDSSSGASSGSSSGSSAGGGGKPSGH